MNSVDQDLVRVESLSKHFYRQDGWLFGRQRAIVRAVNDINFSIHRGETLGLVGESGCGKSTLGRVILQLLRPTAGSIYFEGRDLSQLRGEALRGTRRNMQMVFQDPYGSLDPRMKVGGIISAPLRAHGLGNKKQHRDRVREILELVGLNPAMAERFPYEFSGGQRQRIGIARAIILQPAFIVCDEPISALDVSIQAQVVNLLADLQKKFSLTYLFIAHDLSMIRHISTRVAVMYLGKIVEIAPRDHLFQRPQHPYTEALFSAVPIANPLKERHRRRIVLSGEVPDPTDPPTGCAFHPRCAYSDQNRCIREQPALRRLNDNRLSACHYAEELELLGVMPPGDPP